LAHGSLEISFDFSGNSHHITFGLRLDLAERFSKLKNTCLFSGILRHHRLGVGMHSTECHCRLYIGSHCTLSMYY